MKLSIIVPVYNMASDNKLSWCLDSLLNQTVSDYEIIAVDDCSTDDSLSVLREYEEKYPDKVRVFHLEENLHQGGAKNVGLKKATGDWIGFIDSDDWIKPYMYEKMIDKAEETGADIVGCDYSLVYEHTYEVGDEIVHNSTDAQTGVLGHENKAQMILDGGSLCVKIFKRKTIIENELWFPEHIFYEDNAMSDSYMLLANRFEYIKEPMYYYFQHNTSTVHSFSKERCDDRCVAGRMILSQARKLGFYEEFKKEIEYQFTQLFYINTLFTYMPCVKPTRVSYVRKLTKELLDNFPRFYENEYYLERTPEEEKKLILMAVKSPACFYLYYKLLWGYRNLRKKMKK